MKSKELDSAAQILLDSFLETSAYNRTFKDEQGGPLTLAAKAHVLRAVIQAKFLKLPDQFRLGSQYAEFGRVEFVDLTNERTYLLRSRSAIGIEQAKPGLRLFSYDDVPLSASDVILAIYQFGPHGLDLSTAGTHRSTNGRRLEISGDVTYIGTWPFEPTDGEPFDQRYIDAFEDLGVVDVDGEESGS